MKVEIALDGKNHQVELAKLGERLRCAIDGSALEADAVQIAPGIYSVLVDGVSLEVRVEPDGGSLRLTVADREWRAEIRDPREWRRESRWRGGSGGAAAGLRANARENRSSPCGSRRFGQRETRLVCSGSDENAERNSVAEIWKGGAAARNRRPNCECRGSSRDHRVTPKATRGSSLHLR